MGSRSSERHPERPDHSGRRRALRAQEDSFAEYVKGLCLRKGIENHLHSKEVKILASVEAWACSRSTRRLLEGLPSDYEANDFMADVVLNVLARGTQASLTKAYLHVAARNQLASHYRSAYRNRCIPYPEDEDVREGVEPRDESQEYARAWEDLEAWLRSRLKPETFELVMQAFLSDESRASLARRYRVDERTIRRRLEDACELLRGNDELR